MLLTSLAFLPLSLQVLEDVVVKNDNPETWVLEYPLRLKPYVSDYRACLNRANRTTTGKPDFEMWHRGDLKRCEKQRAKLVAQSKEASSRSEEGLSAGEVEELFRKIETIHIARGRDLDDQLKERFASAAASTEQYEKKRPEGLIIELVDATVVKSRAELQGAETPSARNEIQNAGANPQ